MTVRHQAIDSVTGARYTWSAADYDAGAGYPGPNSPTNILVIGGLGPGKTGRDGHDGTQVGYLPVDFVCPGPLSTLTNLAAGYFDVGSGALAAGLSVLLLAGIGGVYPGLYTLSANGDNWNLTPRSDWQQDEDVKPGFAVFARQGHANAQEMFVCSGATIATATWTPSRGALRKQAKLVPTVADNAPAIDSAVTQAGNFGLVEFPASSTVIPITQSISINQAKMIIRGAGRDRTRLRLDAGAAYLINVAGALSGALNAVVEELTIEDLEIDGNNLAAHILPIFAGAVRKLRVHRCRFKGFLNNAIYVAGGTELDCEDNEFYIDGSTGGTSGCAYLITKGSLGGRISRDRFVNINKAIQIISADSPYSETTRDLTIEHCRFRNHWYSRAVPVTISGVTYTGSGADVTYGEQTVSTATQGNLRDAGKTLHTTDIPSTSYARVMAPRASGTAGMANQILNDESTDFIAAGVLKGEIVKLTALNLWGVIHRVEQHTLAVNCWFDPVTLIARNYIPTTLVAYEVDAVFLLCLYPAYSTADEHTVCGLQRWHDMQGTAIVPNGPGSLLVDGLRYDILAQNLFPISVSSAANPAFKDAEGLTISDNEFIESYSDCIGLVNTDHSVITRNRMYFCMDTMIDFMGSSSGCVAAHNTAVRPGASMFAIEGTKHHIHDNTVEGSGWNCGETKAAILAYFYGSGHSVHHNTHDYDGVVAGPQRVQFGLGCTDSLFEHNKWLNKPGGQANDYSIGAINTVTGGNNRIIHDTDAIACESFFPGAETAGPGDPCWLTVEGTTDPDAAPCVAAANTGSIYRNITTGTLWSYTGATWQQLAFVVP